MFTDTIDGVRFSLKKFHDLSFLKRYGKVFCVFDQNISGNLSLGMEDGAERRFIKIAGKSPAARSKPLSRALTHEFDPNNRRVQAGHPFSYRISVGKRRMSF